MKKSTCGFARLLAVAATALIFSLSEWAFVKAQSPPTGPQWSRTATPRLQHSTLTRLYNGKVIAIGGQDSRRYEIKDVELYDPLTNTWRDTAPLNYARFAHTAILLADGRLLVIGGTRQTGNDSSGTAAGPPEIFDPATEKWTVQGSAFFYRSLILPLSNGKVLALGAIFNMAHVFDPATGISKQISPPRGMTGNPLPSALTLPDGKLLHLSGANDVASAEFFDPATESWTTTNVPNSNGFVLSGRLAALLPDGKALAFVGFPDGPPLTALFDPRTETWGNLVARNTGNPSALTLPNGEVLSFDFFAAEVFSGNSNTWRTTPAAPPPIFGEALLASGQAFTGASVYGLDFGAATSSPLVSTSAASFRVDTLARGSIVAAFGTNLGDPATPNLTQVFVKDSGGFEFPARVLAVSPDQVNFVLPEINTLGQAEVTVKNKGALVARGLLGVVGVSPGLFTANADGRGVPAAVVQRVKADNSVSYEPVASFDNSTNRFVPSPIDLGVESDQVYLVLFGTGWGNQSPDRVQVYIGDVKARVLFAGKHPDFAGLDQINVSLPRKLIGRGEVDAFVTIAGKTANPIKLRIK